MLFLTHILCSAKLSSSTNIIKRPLHNFCTLGKNTAIVFEKWLLVNTEKFCAIEPLAWGSNDLLWSWWLFYSILIDTHCTAFLGPMISHGADTRLHAWRNTSLSTGRKLDKRVILLPLNQGHCQPHHTEASLTVSQPLVSWGSPSLKT